MRIVKLALISMVVIFIMATLFSLLIPSRVRISKAIDIGASKDSIMALIKDQQRWSQWHPVFMPNDSFPKPAPVTIAKKILTDSSIVMVIHEAGRKPLVNGWNFITYEQPDVVTVQWYMDFHLEWYPWKKLGSLFLEDSYGPMMQKGLGHLKRLTEK